MHVIQARNVHEMLAHTISHLKISHVERESRNGPVKVFRTPVTLVYERPEERVLTQPERDANPFFHLMECLWMLAGRNDVNYVARYASNMRSFSDDGRTLNGAYGYRWRHHFATVSPTDENEVVVIDQLETCIARLAKDPNDRRVVLGMWDPSWDLVRTSKDLPCNTHIYFRVDDGFLNMTVCNRSNDVVWGACGANAVHMSFLQEYVARSLGLKVGRYWQTSNNMHLYVNTHGDLMENQSALFTPSVYEPSEDRPHPATPVPIMSVEPEVWRQDLHMWMEEGVTIGLRESWFRRVAHPVKCAWDHYKDGEGIDRYDGAIEILEQCAAPDWRVACTEWMERRRAKFLRATDDGPIHE